jgi:hypothetical protein
VRDFGLAAPRRVAMQPLAAGDLRRYAAFKVFSIEWKAKLIAFNQVY